MAIWARRNDNERYFSDVKLENLTESYARTFCEVSTDKASGSLQCHSENTENFETPSEATEQPQAGNFGSDNLH